MKTLVAPQIRFEEEGHRYFLADRELPSVTKVIESVGLIDTQWFTEQSAIRGKYLHQATALDDAGRLEESSVHPIIAPYLHGWRRFVEQSGATFELTEHQVCHELYGYAGTLDRLGTMNGCEGIFDIKTGEPNKVVGVQLSAYREAVKWPRPLRRWGVFVNNEGGFQVREYKNPNDFKVFAACLAIENWRKQ